MVSLLLNYPTLHVSGNCFPCRMIACQSPGTLIASSLLHSGEQRGEKRENQEQEWGGQTPRTDQAVGWLANGPSSSLRVERESRSCTVLPQLQGQQQGKSVLALKACSDSGSSRERPSLRPQAPARGTQPWSPSVRAGSCRNPRTSTDHFAKGPRNKNQTKNPKHVISRNGLLLLLGNRNRSCRQLEKCLESINEENK